MRQYLNDNILYSAGVFAPNEMHQLSFYFRMETCINTCCVGDVGLICLLNSGERKPKLHLNIDSNPLNCDCKDYIVISIVRFYAHSHLLDRVYCGEPPELHDVRVSFAR